MIALMLESLAPGAGDRVLEVGTGSGYHAALLAELVGAGRDSVTTTDLDADLAARAAAAIDEARLREGARARCRRRPGRPGKEPHSDRVASPRVATTSPTRGGARFREERGWCCRYVWKVPASTRSVSSVAAHDRKRRRPSVRVSSVARRSRR